MKVFSYIRLRVFAWVFLRIVAGCCLKLILHKRIARNEMEGFLLGRFPRSTEGAVKSQTYLTEPQGIIKKCLILRI